MGFLLFYFFKLIFSSETLCILYVIFRITVGKLKQTTCFVFRDNREYKKRKRNNFFSRTKLTRFATDPTKQNFHFWNDAAFKCTTTICRVQYDAVLKLITWSTYHYYYYRYYYYYCKRVLCIMNTVIIAKCQHLLRVTQLRGIHKRADTHARGRNVGSARPI